MAKRLRQISDLTTSTQVQDLISHHDSVLNYYHEADAKAERGFNFVRGNQLTTAEKEQYRIRGKSPVIFNTLKPSERAILGTFESTKMDMKWSPQKPADQNIAVIMESLRLWEAEKNGDKYNDIELIRQAWAGKGASYQECYVDVVPGKQTEIRTNQLNPFYVHFDPESRLLITREDAQFVDVDSWATKEELCETFPKAKNVISRGEEQSQNDVTGYQKPARIYNDRDAQTETERNGKYKVIERYYRVRKSYFYCVMKGEDRYEEIAEDGITAFEQQYPNETISKGFREELWYAVACEGLSSIEYIYNAPYHTQVINPYTRRVMWPILEFVAESLNGDPSSFVEHEIDPQRTLNSMIGNVANSAAHAASQSKIMHADSFIDEKEAQNFAQFHSDSNKVFRVKHKAIKEGAFRTVDNSQVSPDVHNMITYANNFMDVVSATPPAIQGTREGQETGVLHAQRVEQAQNQLKPMLVNYKQFLEQRTILRYMYWMEYYTEEMTFKVVDTTLLKGTEMEGQEFVTINQKVPEQDDWGNYIPGRSTVKNAINTVLYSLTAEESVKSSSYRNKVMMQLEEVLKAPAVQNDPPMMAAIFQVYIQMTDAPQAVKDMIASRSSVLEQYDKQKFEAGELAKQQQQAQIQQAQQQQQQQAVEAQNQQIEMQKNQMDFQMDAQKNSIEVRKLRLEADTLELEKQKTLLQMQEMQMKNGEGAQKLRAGEVDIQLKAKDLPLKDLEAEEKQLDIIGKEEEIAQTRADNTGFTIQDIKEEKRASRDAAIKEATANRAGGDTQNPKKES